MHRIVLREACGRLLGCLQAIQRRIIDIIGGGEDDAPNALTPAGQRRHMVTEPDVVAEVLVQPTCLLAGALGGACKVDDRLWVEGWKFGGAQIIQVCLAIERDVARRSGVGLRSPTSTVARSFTSLGASSKPMVPAPPVTKTRLIVMRVESIRPPAVRSCKSPPTCCR
jgi:hypothetical protein